ncbi:response regulator with CheY-like receiver, AAA-type ATPase, and DNA-binding domains [Desulfosporosinus acidiphilus SJ4]|uniref:Stage 0 sporulation protein A homolog n=1 Tax=Desulfosporosinus acidiphilus (strain DSM 22704 / JCM 16185 / SJ4) TaxID=646529 RepID=I4D713_DESAJ|nr:response regulator [Desulfosporosinus acidiphilus]AFM41587.1 response regulator with CheY-like receiver, AAA-type ATPase, and DNA-binding domains [Desulfosporosinus acidiphilus SJ4]
MANILIVEDNAAISRVIQLALEENGHIVQFCKSGNEAIDLLSKQTPDLVITDIQLPGKSGKDIIEKMRSENRLSNVPAIIMTAHTPDNKTFPEESLYQGLIVKPFELEQLKLTVNHCIT